ncbi:RICIN domain-containing protein [Streptomyces sp. SID12488]|uniref:RICIN domain-containing protein n=1 Tax=Streptomyces sp. SID12488 TaxID=2706040 RepID=UPI0013D9CBEF|nr:RICIN domain-containing protein [Streptomyces sp. SID12488]NEA64149.1 ricin-type beta-trefoil lectin domain protein [Streptomyces sp. SID12488]
MSQDTGHSGVDGEYGEYVGASDAHLTELLRTNSPTAYLALQELRARHRASVLAYARLCTTSDSTAGQLAAQAFTVAARDTARGTEPSVPWRHQLLLLTADLAATWATDERAAGLDPSLLLVLNTLAPMNTPMNAGSAQGAAGGAGLIPPPPMLGPFQSLPSRTQGLIWYGIVEREPEDRTAALLGLTREDVTHETDSALQALAQACLRFRLAVSDDPRCQDFRRLIEESVRPVNPRHSTDLNSHMVICPHCSVAYEELAALRDNPRTALGEGLLPWSGLSYARDAPTVTRANTRQPEGSWPWTPARPSRRRFVLASAVLGVTLVPLVIVLLSQSGGSPDTQGAAGTLPVTAVPSVSGATSPSSPAAADSPSPAPTSRPPTTPTPSPSPTPKPTPTPTPTATPAFRAPGASFAQVVNVASGRCLDIRGGVLEKGTDVVTATCSTSAATQRWQVDAGSGLLRSSADTDLCLDSRGDVDKGVGIWECESVSDSENGDNLRFTVDDDGVIRPAIAIATGLTPAGDDGLTLEPLTGGSGQRWRAGAS